MKSVLVFAESFRTEGLGNPRNPLDLPRLAEGKA